MAGWWVPFPVGLASSRSSVASRTVKRRLCGPVHNRSRRTSAHLTGEREQQDRAHTLGATYLLHHLTGPDCNDSGTGSGATELQLALPRRLRRPSLQYHPFA